MIFSFFKMFYVAISSSTKNVPNTGVNTEVPNQLTSIHFQSLVSAFNAVLMPGQPTYTTWNPEHLTKYLHA